MSEPGVVVTLTEIYGQQQMTASKVDKLTVVVESLAKVDKRIDAQDKRMDAADEKMLEQDARLGVLEQNQAVQQALVKPKQSGVQIATAIGSMVGSLGSLIALLVLMDKILGAYNGG